MRTASTTRRSSRSRRTSRSWIRRWPLRSWLISFSCGLIFLALLLSIVVLVRNTAPATNCSREHFDVIIVLGSPTDPDGNPTPVQQASVTEAVREYERGVAPHMIFTGAAAHNAFVEAASMARTARSMGVPASAIVEEAQAHNTIQNARYSWQQMQKHGWKSAEIVTTPAHLPRAALIFDRLPMDWRAHAAPATENSASCLPVSIEILKTAHYLFWSRWTETLQP